MLSFTYMEITDQKVDEIIDLRAWIQKRVREYKEPARAGLSRGEELPIPKHKYHAALLMLLHGSKAYPSLYQISKEAGCKYGLIGKWRTERKFVDLTKKAAEEFLDEWLELYLWARSERRDVKNGQAPTGCEALLNRLGYLIQTTWGYLLIMQVYRRLNGILKNPDTSYSVRLDYASLLLSYLLPIDNKRMASLVGILKEVSQAVVESLKKLTLAAVKNGNKEEAETLINLMTQAMVKSMDDYWDLRAQIPLKRRTKA